MKPSLLAGHMDNPVSWTALLLGVCFENTLRCMTQCAAHEGSRSQARSGTGAHRDKLGIDPLRGSGEAEVKDDYYASPMRSSKARKPGCRSESARPWMKRGLESYGFRGFVDLLSAEIETQNQNNMLPLAENQLRMQIPESCCQDA